MAVAYQLHEDVWPAWLQTAWYPGDEARRDILLGVLAAVDPAPVCAWQDPLIFLEPMDKSVSSAMYWQPPHETDVVLTDPEVVAALRPVAATVAAAPAAEWWSTPVDAAALRYTSLFNGDEASLPPLLTGARERLSRWRDRTLADEADAAAHRPADPAAPYSGHWWSTPALASLVTTTRPLAGLGSVALAWQEDSTGNRRAAIWPVATTGEPRVWEIDRPDAWTRLVERYPLEVTHARRHGWYKTTGRTGTWHIPDWGAVDADWDAVHDGGGSRQPKRVAPSSAGVPR